MKWMQHVARLFGLLPSPTADDEINASNAQALDEHREMLEAVRAQSASRGERNSRLRAAIAEAKSAVAVTPALGAFERAIQERPESVRRID